MLDDLGKQFKVDSKRIYVTGFSNGAAMTFRLGAELSGRIARLPIRLLRAVADELTKQFGCLTAYTRAPAQGLWKKKGAAQASRDEIVIYEVMAERLRRSWWKQYQHGLESRFRQEKLVVRVQEIELL